MTPRKHNDTGVERQNYAIQILTAPTADTAGTVVALNFENNRYLFGHIGEGTQRAMIQRGFGLRNVQNIFLTGITNWESNGGLFGAILTLAEVHKQQVPDSEPEKSSRTVPGDSDRTWVNIYGSTMLLHTLATARRFIFRTGMPLTVQETAGDAIDWSADPMYTDENIRVWNIPIRDSTQVRANQVAQQDADLVQREQNVRAKVVKDMFDSGWRKDRLIATTFKDAKLPAMVFVRDPTTKSLKGYHCPNHESAPLHFKPDQKVLIRDPWPASLVPDLPSASNLPTGIATSYIVRGHQQRGKFDPKKAIELGVKPGPLFSKLTAGESIEVDNGKVVKPEDVLGPSRIGKGLAFFDLPTVGHLNTLYESLKSADSDALPGVAVAVWMLGHGVAASQQFRELVQSLDQLEHLLSDPDTAQNKLSFESTALLTSRLAKIDPSRFKPTVYSETPYGHEALSETPPSQGLPTVPVEAGMRVNIEPTYEVIRDEIPALQLLQNDTLELPKQILYASGPAPALKTSAADELSEPEFITLGTGSSNPSKYRNVSATLVRLPHNQGNFLLDCGEGTMGQLRRAFPANELQGVLQNLQGIWISHLHADHHLGTISVLQARATALKSLREAGENVDQPIYLMSEKNMIDFVNEYSTVEPSLLSETGLVPLICTQERGPLLNGEMYSFDARDTALQSVKTVRVAHCAGAQAVTIAFKSGLKVSYSGDCRPSVQFCEIGRDSDILIHEATFDDDKQGDALAKKHCTTAEALGVAMRMKAKNVLLTHFSQRYSKIPNFSTVKLPNDIRFEEAAANQDDDPIEDDGPPSANSVSAEDASLVDDQQRQPRRNSREVKRAPTPATNLPIAVAFDLMRIKLSQIATAKDYYPNIETLFALQEAANDERREVNRKASEAYQRHKAEKTQKLFEENQKKKKKAEKGPEQQRRKKSGDGQAGVEGGERAGHDVDGEPSSFANGSGATVAEVSKQDRSQHHDGSEKQERNLKRKAASPLEQREGVNGVDVADEPPLSKRAQKALQRKKWIRERKETVAAAEVAVVPEAEEG